MKVNLSKIEQVGAYDACAVVMSSKTITSSSIVIVESRCVKNNKNKKFAIVPQNNRVNELYANVVNHFTWLFTPM